MDSVALNKVIDLTIQVLPFIVVGSIIILLWKIRGAPDRYLQTYPRWLDRFFLFRKGQAAIDAAISDYVLLGQTAKATFVDIAQANSLPLKRLPSAEKAAIIKTVSSIMQTRFLTADEAARVSAACEYLEFEPASCSGVREALQKSAVIRGLETGELPSVSVAGFNPVHLQKGEQLIWAFNGVVLFEVRKSISYSGRSRGLSVRVAKGLYYRTGAYRGRRIENNRVLPTASGDLAFSTKSLYFVSKTKALRIPVAKIICVNLFSDGIEIFRDAAGGRPLLLKLSDPGFAATLIGHIEG